MPESGIKQLVYKIILFCLRPLEWLLEHCKKKKQLLLVIGYRSISERGLFLGEYLKKNPGMRLWCTFTRPEKLTALERRHISRQYRYLPYHIARFIKWDMILFCNHDRPFRPDVHNFYLRHGHSVNKLNADGNILIFGEVGRNRAGELIFQTISLESEYVKNLVLKKYPQMHDRVVVAGEMVVESMLTKKKPKKSLFLEHGFDPERKILITFSTWGKSSLLHNCGEQLLASLHKLAAQYNVICAIHPKTANRHDEGYEPITERIRELAQQQKHLVFSGDVSWQDFAPYCDAMLTDSTSACLYLLPFVSAVVFLETPHATYWSESPLNMLKNTATRITSLNAVAQSLASELLGDKKSVYEELAVKALGDWRTSRLAHEGIVCQKLGIPPLPAQERNGHD